MTKTDKIIKGLKELKIIQEAIIRANEKKKHNADTTKHFKKILEDAITYISEAEKQKQNAS